MTMTHDHLHAQFDRAGCILEGVAQLKQRIAELERRDTEHTVHIAKMNAYIRELEEAQRWHKFSEEKPEYHQWILVHCPNHSEFTSGFELRRWDEGLKFDVEIQEMYDNWMPLPKAPEEE